MITASRREAQLGFIGVAGVVVRRGRVEFGGASVDGLVDRAETVGPAQLTDGVLAFIAQTTQVGQLQVGQTGELRLLEQLPGERFCRVLTFMAVSLMRKICFRNHGSILVAANTCSSVAPPQGRA